MAARFTLYYWPIPFRGQPIRWVLADAGAEWDEAGGEALVAVKGKDPRNQPVPFMAPPMLVDHQAGVSFSQMPAILGYLGRIFGRVPQDPGGVAAVDMVLASVNDVLEDITRNGGKSMWDQASWDAFAGGRLLRWMRIFEEHLRRGPPAPGPGGAVALSDLVAGCLWYTMTDKLPAIGALLGQHAPHMAALSQRLADRPAIAALRAKTDADYGGVYCGGQIEASLRNVILANTGKDRG